MRYLLIEIYQLLMFCAIYHKYDITPYSIFLMVFSVIMTIHIVTDLEHYMISDMVNYIALVVAIILVYLSNENTIIESLFIGFFTGLSLWVVGLLVSTVLKKPALGFGDVKIIFILGMISNSFVDILIIFILSGLIGTILSIIWKKIHNNPIFPFAPPLIISFFLEHMYITDFLHKYFVL